MIPSFHNYNYQPIQYVQRKMNGHFVRINFCRESLWAMSKNGEPITLPDHIRQYFRDHLPQRSIVLGELHCPGIPETSVPTMLNNNDEALQLSLFAVPVFDGIDWSQKPLNVVASIIGPMFIPVTKLFDEPTCLSKWDVLGLLEEARLENIEGHVLKREHMDGWYKLKPVREMDVFVFAYQTSQSASNWGGLKAVSVGVYDEKGKLKDMGNVGSGFDHDFRMEVNKKSLLSRVMKVEYDNLAANGKLKFPRFISWRTDKKADQCLLNQCITNG